jgi:hypothetical protein
MNGAATMAAREQRVARRATHRKARIAANRAQSRQQGPGPRASAVPRGVSASNATCSYTRSAQERQARQEASMQQMETLRHQWPVLERRLVQIEDLRAPKKIKHRLAVLMLYGVLMFVLQRTSRRQANRDMTRPQFLENLRLWFPEVEQLPHQDTLARVLSNSSVEEIEGALVDLVGALIRKKKFARYLVATCYPVCMDGTQKLKRNELVQGQWLTRTVRKKDGTEEQHYVYVLEVSLGFHNGMTIPLLSEFLTYAGGEESKQDCEQRAFQRACERLKAQFPKLPMVLLLDGLYPNGPVLERCRKYGWQYMIVLPDACLASVWEEYRGLAKIERGNQKKMRWKGRHQCFTWVNHIVYRYGDNDHKQQIVHLVVCEESWEEIDDTGKLAPKSARHAWLSSEPLRHTNVHERCNLGARHRWGIEESLLAEKRHGYSYEHCFAEDWNALRGYHYLMRIGHLINILVWYSSALSHVVRSLGVRGLLEFIWTTLVGPWFDAQEVRARRHRPWQLRLI